MRGGTGIHGVGHHRVRGAVRLSACVLTGAALAACHEGVLDARGPIAGAERLILLNATAIMLVVVVPVILLTVAFAWYYRASNTRARYEPSWDYSGRVELVVWSIPAMVVLLLAGVEWIGTHELDPGRAIPSAAAPLHLQVVSMDWKWLFVYPDAKVAVVNELTVPAGTPLELSLTSATVMTAFFVPQLGSMIYTMPGMTTHLNLLAERPGDYPGLASHFSGDGFSDMHFTVHAIPAAAYAAWVAGAHAGPKLDAASYAELAHPATSAVRTYGSVADGLYDHVLKTSAPMGPAATPAAAAAIAALER